jgi:hypothetical protein
MRCRLDFRLFLLLIAVLAAGTWKPLAAQHLFAGAGVGAATIPRAKAPLCGSARRLNGAGLTGRAGVAMRSWRAFATVEHVSTLGTRDIADCVPRSGLSVDSVFDDANFSATTIGIGASLPVTGILHVGAEAGTVLDHSSWFAGPSISAQYRSVRLEITARGYATKFEEIMRDYGPPIVFEMSRESRTETSWGGSLRLMLVTR